MDAFIRSLNRNLKAYDRELFAERAPCGRVDVWRKGYRYENFVFNGMNILYARPLPRHIFSLTKNWMMSSEPVEWGIEPVMEHLRDLDAWRDDTSFDQMVKKREQIKENEQRAMKNELRAMAYDIRKDFAKATNDINTSTMEKVDTRRHYGNR